MPQPNQTPGGDPAPAPNGDGDDPAPAPNGDGGSPIAKITIPGGITVEVPREQAEAYHAAAAKANAEREELARRIGSVEAERRAAEEAAAREAADKEAIRLAKDGEIAKARELLTAEAEGRLRRIGDRMIAQEIEAAARRMISGIDHTAVDDIVALVTPRAAFDADSGSVHFLGLDGSPAQVDGKPAGADAFLADFLSARKHFQPARLPAKTGGGDPAPPPTPGTIRRSEIPTMTPAQAEAMERGLLTVVDD